MVEELLQLLIAEVDADLLKCIEFKDLQKEKVFDPPMDMCKCLSIESILTSNPAMSRIPMKFTSTNEK